MNKKPITVSQLNGYISQIFRSNSILSNVRVTGEITGLKMASSGHWYFSIKDKDSRVNCVLFKNSLANIRYDLTDGLEVIIEGAVTAYEPYGTYSLNVRKVEVSGEGNLAIAFQTMKIKLEDEGLFAPERKKTIPKYPRHIGVITSGSGAAVKDIIQTIKNKNDVVKIVIFPTMVQGAEAAGDIAEKIAIANTKYPWIDTLIVGRGGGSTEDLWAFNEEIVARAIYDSQIPIISGVGHEVDFTISDMVADYRAETPTAAAEKAVYNSYELRYWIESCREVLSNALVNKTSTEREKANLFWKNCKQEAMYRIRQTIFHISKLKLILDAYNPNKIMDRGYAVAMDRNRNIIRTTAQIDAGDDIFVELSDGSLSCTVNGINPLKDRS